jgi:trans-aconitate 2-methyltransferase
MNREEPLFRAIEDVASDPKWGIGRVGAGVDNTLSPEEYYDLLSGCSSDFQMWETVYCHALPSHQALVDWVRGSRLRPYLDTLDKEGKAAFENDILRRVEEEYPIRKDGCTLLHFRRFFFVAARQ